MLEQYLGPEVYRDGIRRYLRDHAYANTTTSDLWDALETASGEPVGEVMATWIYQGGHPTVRLGDGAISQSPFAFGPATGPSAIGSSWSVPLRVRRLDGGPATSQLLGATPVAHGPGAATVLNAGGAGAYRSSYSSDELSALASQLSSLTEIERAVVIGDAWALTRAGQQSVRDFFELAGGLGTLVEPASWSVVERALGLLARIDTGDGGLAVRSKAAALFAPVLSALGWEPRASETEQAPAVRATAISVLGGLGEDPSVRAEAARRFDAGAVDGDLAGAVVSVVASMARPGDLDEMLARMLGASDPQAEQRYLRGIAAIADTGAALRTLGNTFKWFRTQDAPRVIYDLMCNPVAGPAVWDEVAASWDETCARVPAQMQVYLGIGLGGFVDDPEFATRVAAFHGSHALESGQPLVVQAVEQMLHGVAFAERVRPGLPAELA